MAGVGIMLQGYAAMQGFVKAYMEAEDGNTWGADIGVVQARDEEPPFVIIAAVVNEVEAIRYGFTVSEWDALRLRILQFIDLFHRHNTPQVLSSLVEQMGDILAEAMKVQKNMKAGMH